MAEAYVINDPVTRGDATVTRKSGVASHINTVENQRVRRQLLMSVTRVTRLSLFHPYTRAYKHSVQNASQASQASQRGVFEGVKWF